MTACRPCLLLLIVALGMRANELSLFAQTEPASKKKEPAAAPASAKEDKWESAFRSFEEADAKSPPVAGGVVFVGSSSVRMWKLNESFPNHGYVNRGFGGSHLGDAARSVERIVIPHKPRIIVVYAGDNDIAGGKTPATVFSDFVTLRDKVRQALPATKIVFIAIKPSPKRWELREKAQEANRLIREETQRDTGLAYIDVWGPMLGADGLPRDELFVQDKLHLNATGYNLWTSLIEPHLVK